MDTSRVVINIRDNSSTLTDTSTAVTGFTVVKAPKGPITPVLITGENKHATLQDIFGVSSKEYPELFEVETFSNEYDLYVSAPYLEAKIPIAYVTGNGIVKGNTLVNYDTKIEAYVSGEESELENVPGITSLIDDDLGTILRDIKDPKASGLPGTTVAGNKTAIYSADNTYGVLITTGIKYGEFVEGNVPTEFKVKKVANDTTIIAEYTIDGTTIKKDGVSAGKLLVEKEVTNGETTSTQKVEPGAGDENLVVSLFITDSDLSITSTTPPADLEAMEYNWIDHLRYGDVYAVIFPKYPSVEGDRVLHIDFEGFGEFREASNYQNWNRLNMDLWEEGSFHSTLSDRLREQKVTLDSENEASSEYLGISDFNNSQNLVSIYKIKKFDANSTFDTDKEEFDSIVLEGGTRKLEPEEGENLATTIYDIGWKQALGSEYSEVDIFFDSSVHEVGTQKSEPNSIFLKMATDDMTSHKLAGYVFNKTLPPTMITGASGEVLSGVTSHRLTYGYNYWNISNVCIVPIGDDRMVSSMTGAYACMIARIIQYKHGGAAPMWTNTSVNNTSIGGQLDSLMGRTSRYKLKYTYNKKHLDVLDALNYNPVVDDRQQYGFMVTSQKTCKLGDVTDWSYIGHTASFLNFLKQVRTNVMIPQIGKPNNPYYRTLRKDQVLAYLTARTQGEGRIWTWAECDTSTAAGVNDVYALKARKFVINVRVQVDVFSEKVELNFTNEGQESTISVQ